MKIWILTTEFPPHFGGGIGTYVENVADMYSKNGDKVKVILRDDEDTVKKLNENLEVHRFILNNDDEYTAYMGYAQAVAFQYLKYIKKLLSQGEKPDIIEIQEYNAIGYYIFQNKLIDSTFLSDVPVVVHLHTPQFALWDVNKFSKYQLPDYWIGQMERFCIKAADAILCPSQFLADKLKDVNPEKKIKVINLPFATPKEEDNIKSEIDEKLFVYFGRTEYRKGVAQLVEAFERLWQKGYDCKLKIIGGDVEYYPKKEFLGKLLQKKYKNRIQEGLLIFQGNTAPEPLRAEIRKARATIIPSLYENFPNTCILSMWLEKVAIVSKQGGQAEMVETDGVNGYIFNHEIEGDLENKVIQVLNDSNEKLEEIGKNAKKRINSLCNMTDNVKMRKEFFNQIIAEYKPKTIYPFLNDTSKYNSKNNKVENDMLSVVIPYYNMGKYIDDAVNSAKKSTYKNKEIIILNDGSTEQESIEALKKYEKDPMIRIVTIKNGGLANARNVGASYAKGGYIAFLDADDAVSENFYKESVDMLQRFNNVSYVFSFIKYFEGDNAAWNQFDTQLPYLLCHNMVGTCVVIRKEDFLKYGQNRPEMEFGMEDYDMWLSLAENNCFGVCIPKYHFLYRVRKDSMARGFNKNNLLYLTQIITKNHKNLFIEYGDEIFNILQANGSSYKYSNPSFYIPEETNIVIQKRRMKDVLWKYKAYRGFIKFLQATGIMKVLKCFKKS
ncbi:MAG: glycosyltransferase [Clostridia bacterium]|nr:glycosyltransferase [Clostridia bacterium]